MTNDEAAKLLNGGDEVSAAPAGNSEPTPAAEPVKEQPETVAADPKPNKDTVNPTEAKPAPSESDGAKPKKDSKKKGNFYSQQRAEHEFARQSRYIKNLKAENEDLKAQLEKLKDTTKETFIDKVSGKLDEAGYAEFLAKKTNMEMQSKRIEREAEDLQNEQDEIAWNNRVERELGESADKFHEMCSEVVDDEGTTRFQAFIGWLEGKDPQQVIISRINDSKTGVRLLNKLMTDKEARMSVIKAETPHKKELALDKIEEGLTSVTAEPNEKKPTFAESWKARQKENTKPENKPKPTGSAFSGEQKSAGPMHKDNNYFASLL